MGGGGADLLCRDAVMVVPGIMGTTLWDTEKDRPVWGSGGAFVRSWIGGSPLTAMRLAPGEWQERRPRVMPKALITGPVWLPELRGLEPYTGLLRELGRVVADPAALRTFPYDWRLPVHHNAQLLSEAVERHLAQWRRHRAADPDARVVIVAHSMGGLLARYLTGVLGGSALVRHTIAVGTPFYGAVKATVMLNQGRGAPVPLPRRRLRSLAATLPAVYDLLPSYRCLVTDSGVRRLTESDVVALGGDPALARMSMRTHAKLAGVGSGGLSTVVGLGQPTAQSMTLQDGVVTTHNLLDEDGTGDDPPDRDGDETVYSESATGGVEAISYVCQTHGNLASTPEVSFHIAARLVRRRLGPPLGHRPHPIGLDLPDPVAAGVPFTVRVPGSVNAAGTQVSAQDAHTSQQVARCRSMQPAPAGLHGQPVLTGELVLPRPGLYRVLAKRGAPSPVTQLVLALPRDELDDTRGHE
jgi:pimeloyl-ACP methyl ester carboxylesterase